MRELSVFFCPVLAAATIMTFSHVLAAQQSASNSVDAQREAMRKLSFLVGHWAGPVTIARGPGEQAVS